MLFDKLANLEIKSNVISWSNGFSYYKISINRTDMKLHETNILNGDVIILVSDLEKQDTYLIESNTNNLNEFTVRKRLGYNPSIRDHDVSDVIFEKISNGYYSIKDHENNIWCFDKDHNLIDPEQKYEEFEKAIFYMKLKEMI